MPPELSKSEEQMSTRMEWGVLAVLLAVAAFFRLYHLAEPAFRADTYLFLNICKSTPNWTYIFGHWLELMGISAQLPFPLAFTKLFVQVTGMEPGHLSMRLPAACWGIATVAAAWCLGRRLSGFRGAFTLAALAAFGPYLIMTAREAYFYPPMVFGSFLLPIAALDALRGAWLREDRISGTRIAAHLAGMFLMIYSQPSGWFCAFVLVTVSAGASLWQAMKVPVVRGRVVGMIAATAIIGLPVLFADWGVSQLMKSSSAEMRAWASRVFGGGPTLVEMLKTAGTAFFLGKGWLRGGLAAALLVLGLVGVIRQRRERPWLLVVPVVMALGMGSFLLSREATGAGFYSRYVLAYLPLYLCLIAVGLGELSLAVSRRVSRSPVMLQAAMVAVIAGLLTYPAWLSTQLRGKPTPYKDIVSWLDRNLPKGTLVLVDRWYEPWNEFALYPPTNVFVTFTVPDEPYDQFVANKWRDTAKAFFTKYPDAAYMEIARNYWEKPGVGRWDWPNEFFDQHIVISNTAGIKLRDYGLANREDYFTATTNRLLVNIHFNSASNAMRNAVASGRPMPVLYGSGWGYWKPWRQTGRFDDYRQLEDVGVLRLINTTGVARDVQLRLRAVAVGGNKIVNLDGQQTVEFTAGRPMEHTVGPFRLEPGEREFTLRDLVRNEQTALMVESAELLPAAKD